MNSALTFNQFIKNNPFDKKILIVPNYTISEQYIRCANDIGISCINLECQTLYDIAYTICHEQAVINDKILKLINAEMTTNLMMDIMTNELDHLTYFTKQEWIDIPTASAIIAQIDDIRMINAQAILKEKAASPKLNDLNLLLEAYERRLRQDDLVDYISLLQLAIDRVKSEEGFKKINFGIFANTNAVGLERELIQALASDEIKVIKTPYIEGLALPEKFYTKDLSSFEVGNDISKLYRDQSRLLKNPKVDFFRSYGQVNEFKFVIQDILDQGYAFGDVQVIFSHYSYPLLLHNYAKTIDINLSLPGGIPGYHSEIFALLRDIFTFAKNGYFEDDLKPVLHNKLLDIKTSQRSKLRLFEDFNREGVGFGRCRYEKVLEKYKGFENSTDEIEQDYFAFGEFLSSLLKLFPADLSETVKLKNFIQKIALFIPLFCTKNNQNGDYKKECQQFISEIRGFAEFCDVEMSAKSAMDQIQALMEGLTVQSSKEADDAILATSFAAAGIIRRPYVYVIGLDADHFPLQANESPVLLDLERQSMGLTFGLSTSVENNSIYRLLESLAGNIKRLVFGYNYFDTVGIKEKNASSFYNRLLETQKIEKKTICKSGFIGENKNILEKKEYYVFATKKQGKQPTLDTIKRKPLDLCDQVKSSQLLDNKFSASSIMLFLDCPRKYFYTYQAKLRPPQIRDYDRSIWLDAKQKGIFVHKVLEDYVRTIIIHGKEKSFNMAAFTDIYQKNCEEVLEQVPYLSQTAYEMERERYQEDTRQSLLQLCDEMEKEHFLPIAIELLFGMNQEEPVEIHLDNGNIVSLRGAIDRVDRLRDGSYRIVDYKTGKFANMKKKREQGVSGYIQDYIYALVLESIYGETASEVSESRYDFPCDHHAHLKTDITKDTKTEALTILNDLTDEINNGHYERCSSNQLKYTNWEKTCEYCDYDTLCMAEGCAWEVCNGR